jgi:hypothetical protein
MNGGADATGINRDLCAATTETASLEHHGGGVAFDGERHHGKPLHDIEGTRRTGSMRRD